MKTIEKRGYKVMVCNNLTQVEDLKNVKSVYTFDAKRCKAAIEALSDLCDATWNQEQSDHLDNLILDIEDLHRRAQEFDQLLDALGEMMDDDEIYELVLTYKPDDPTEDLVL